MMIIESNVRRAEAAFLRDCSPVVFVDGGVFSR
jgi:hypothetical protein